MPPSRIENASLILSRIFSEELKVISHVLRMHFRRIENASRTLRMLFEELKMLLTL
jgi:hypothetical protein